MPPPFELRPREVVVLARDFEALVAWYRDVLGLREARRFDGGFRYCNLETPGGLRVGIGVAAEAGVEPREPARNSVLLQVEVDDVRAFLEHVARSGGTVTGGPSRDAQGGFWFGGFADPEGNPVWVVDGACP